MEAAHPPAGDPSWAGNSVLSWPESAAAGAALCGGKGTNLGRLERYGFAVPAGGVVSADVYRAFMATARLAERQAALAAVPAEAALRPEVARQLDQLRAAIHETEFDSAFLQQLGKWLAETGLAEVPLAVRSSATAEDGVSASFAGVHQSRLNVRGLPGVQAAIRACYASLWTPQALAYRRRLDCTDDQVACAVVICQMVGGWEGPQAAGVAFTCDPQTGQRGCVMINAVRGLGDALAGGTVTPEELCIELQDGRLRIASRSGQPAAVLSDADAFRLARLAWRVHWALGDGDPPQDIEWVLDQDQLWVVQARPATRVPHLTFAGARHLPIIWSNANVNEVLPGVPSPLTWSQVQGTLRDVLFESVAILGYPAPRMEVCRRFSGRLYFDLTALQWAFCDSLGLSPAEVNRAMGGHQPAIPLPLGNPLAGRRGLPRLRRSLRLAWLLNRADRRLPAEIERLHAAARTARSRELVGSSPSQLLDEWEQWTDRVMAFFHRFMLASGSAGFWLTMLQRALAGRDPARAEPLAGALLAGTGQLTTGEAGYQLCDLADLASREPAAADCLRQAAGDARDWQSLPAGSPFRRAFAAFLEAYGHRCVYESELAHPRWSEDPTFLLDQIRSLLELPDRRAPRARAEQVRRQAEAEVDQLPRPKRAIVRWLARRAREAAALREAGRSVIVAMSTVLRRLALEIGSRMERDGILRQQQDIFQLSWPDVEAYLRGEWSGTGARHLVDDRSAQIAAWQSVTPPAVLILDADGQPTEMPATLADQQTGEVPAAVCRDERHALRLIGLAAAPGRATGRCRVVRHPSQAALLEPGEILVAPSTDPAWTPLFLRAAGVATEVGGALSHGAIVAREYGLPAVLNVPQLLERVSDGDRLTVDGDAGIVSVHPAASPLAREDVPFAG